MLDVLLTVVDPATVILSLIAGMAGGLVLAFVHTLPPSPHNALLMALYVAILGAFFYAGRIGYGLAQGDPVTARVISSFVLWLLFSGGTGIGAYMYGRR